VVECWDLGRGCRGPVTHHERRIVEYTTDGEQKRGIKKKKCEKRRGRGKLTATLKAD